MTVKVKSEFRSFILQFMQASIFLTNKLSKFQKKVCWNEKRMFFIINFKNNFLTINISYKFHPTKGILPLIHLKNIYLPVLWSISRMEVPG